MVGLRRGLPTDLEALHAWQAPPSLLLDRAGAPIATFVLVESVPEGPPPPTLLAEAYLAAAPPSFYEPRVDAATSLPAAVLRVVRGKPPSASPLSLALARALLLGEGHGARRQGREELLATALEGATTVTDRVEAWLDWVPLCRGRRGLQRARRECLGTGDAGWTDAEMATLAAAAAWGIDLAGDAGLLAARRDAVLEQLVRRGLVDPEGARQGGLPHRIESPPSPDCLPELLAHARRAADVSPDRPLRLDSGVDGDVRSLLGRYDVKEALLLDVDSGVVRACRGPTAPTIGSTAALARHALALAGGGQAPGLRWLPNAPVEPAGSALPRVEAWGALLAMEHSGGLRWSLRADRLLLVHPTLAGALRLDDPAEAEALVAGLRALLPRARALLPDDLELVGSPNGPVVRLRARGPSAPGARRRPRRTRDQRGRISSWTWRRRRRRPPGTRPGGSAPPCPGRPR